MPSDNLTFLIGFAAIFGALGWYLWHLERQVAALRQRVDDAEHAAGEDARRVDPTESAARLAAEQAHIDRDTAPMTHGDGGAAATPKNPDPEDAP